MGMCDGPASAPNGTGSRGGRDVVTPMTSALWPVYLAHKPASALWHIFPWHGPMVAVLYRFSSWMSSNPSSTACEMSLTVTSSQKQTNSFLLTAAW